MTMLSKPDGARKSSWIPWIFVGCMIVVVVVNAIMVTLAVRSWSGLVVSKPYERGVAYNRVLEAQHRQDALGWRFQAAYEVTGDDFDGRVVLLASDKAGLPMDGLRLEAKLVRPVERLDPIPLVFDPAGGGRYVARASVPKPGQWELKALIASGDDTYTLAERLFVK